MLALFMIVAIGTRGSAPPREAVDEAETELVVAESVSGELDPVEEATSDEEPIEIPTLPPGESYRLDVIATAGKYSVQFDVTTNIPGSIVAMASLSLEGQSDDDVAIGESKRIAVTHGAGRTSIDTFEIPTGVYDLKVAFYPQWGFADSRSQATGISEPIVWGDSLSVVGNEMPSADFQYRENGRRWAMGNLDRFVASYWDERFGPTEKQRIHSGETAFYFSRLDMTVYTANGSAVRFRMGRDRFGTWEPF